MRYKNNPNIHQHKSNTKTISYSDKQGHLLTFMVPQNRYLFSRAVPRLPTINVRTQLADAFRRLRVHLQIGVTIGASVTYSARLVHQIRGWCWPRRLLAGAAAQQQDQIRTQYDSGR